MVEDRGQLQGMEALQGGFFRRNWVIFTALSLYLLSSLALLKVFPPPWADEVLFALPAESLYSTGKLSTPVVMGMEEHTMWMPPAYFAALGAVFKIFTFDLITMRIFSIVCGIGILLILSVIARQMQLPSFILGTMLVLLVFDPFFQQYSKLGRMDTFTIFWIMTALTAHIRWLKDPKAGWNALAVASAAIACLSHPMGLIAPAGLSIHRSILKKRISPVSLVIVLLPVLLLAGFFALCWHNDPQGFAEQMNFQFSRKAGRGIFTSALNWITRYRTIPFVLTALISGLVISAAGVRRNEWHRPEAAVMIFSAVSILSVIAGFELFYPLYYLPFLVLCVGLSLRGRAGGPPGKSRGIIRALVALSLVNALAYDGYFAATYLIRLPAETRTENILNEISHLLPQDSKGLLLGAPDLYWDLRRERPDLRLYERAALSPLRERQLTESLTFVIAMRAFGPSNDRYERSEIELWQRIFGQHGKTLVAAGTAGREIPYGYRGTVYYLVPFSNLANETGRQP